jgi:hypothetical protein
MKTRDRVIGIVLGILLGLGIVTAFVFLGSESTIDAPGVSGTAPSGSPAGGQRARNPAPRPKKKAKPKKSPQEPAKLARPRTATVHIVGGAPPPSGPAHLDYPARTPVRLRVVSDETVGVQLVGLGLSGTVEAGRPTLLAFRADKPGNYPLIVTASHIAVAQIRVGKPATP